MRAAAVIVTYNAENTIVQCIQAILDQSQVFSRIILIDNNSSDKTVDIVRSKFPDIELILNNDNLGFAVANNQVIRLVNDCPLVALINPDAYLSLDWLSIMISAKKRYPEHGSFASLLLMEDEKTVDGAGDIYHRSGLAWRRFHGFQLSSLILKEEDVFSPCAAAALYDRNTVLEAGGFDESFFCYFEDVDLGFRLNSAGKYCRFIPSARAIHLGSASTGKASAFSIYYGYRNLEWTYIKNMPGMWLWLFLPLHLYLAVLVIAGYASKRKGKAILRAKAHAIAGIFKALRKRKTVSRARIVSSRDLINGMSKDNIFSVLRGKAKTIRRFNSNDG